MLVLTIIIITVVAAGYNDYCWFVCTTCLLADGEERLIKRTQASINVDEFKNYLLVLLGFPRGSLESLCEVLAFETPKVNKTEDT